MTGRERVEPISSEIVCDAGRGTSLDETPPSPFVPHLEHLNARALYRLTQLVDHATCERAATRQGEVDAIPRLAGVELDRTDRSYGGNSSDAALDSLDFLVALFLSEDPKRSCGKLREFKSAIEITFAHTRLHAVGLAKQYHVRVRHRAPVRAHDATANNAGCTLSRILLAASRRWILQHEHDRR